MPFGCLVPLCGLFLAVGLSLFYFMTWKPWSAWLATRFWQPVPCTVVTSRVTESSGADGGSTYRAEIAYSYSVEGREYQGSRYGLTERSSGGSGDKAAIVADHPPGRRTTCWFDPDDPEESVLNRDFSPSLLVGIFPPVFLATNGVVLLWMLLEAKERRARRKALRDGTMQALATALPSPFGVELPAEVERPRSLSSGLSPGTELGCFLVIALFWNGIVSIFVSLVAHAWRDGRGDGCVTLFLAPFVLAGLGLIVLVVRQALVLFNPRLELTLSRGALVPGTSAQVHWKVRGKTERLARLTIVLEGSEEANYQRGNEMKTDKEVFASIPIVDVTHPLEIAEGSARVILPDDTLPSFTAERNKILWKLKAVCEIPGWPDSEDDYEVVVAPAAPR